MTPARGFVSEKLPVLRKRLTEDAGDGGRECVAQAVKIRVAGLCGDGGEGRGDIKGALEALLAGLGLLGGGGAVAEKVHPLRLQQGSVRGGSTSQERQQGEKAKRVRNAP